MSNIILPQKVDRPRPADVASPALSEVHRGVNFGFYARNGYYATREARREVDRMAELGVNWICLIATVFRETAVSTTEFRDFEGTPDDAELRRMIDYIHSKGMRVQLRPMLEGLDGSDRSCVRFPEDRERIPGRSHNYWELWFRSLRHRTIHYARIAEETQCELYGLDSELEFTIFQNRHWKDVIDAARSVYSGPIDSCHTMWTDYLKELENPDHWWYDLDTLSLSAYFPAAQKPGATVEEMVKNLQPVLLQQRAVAEKFGKPYFFGECGCTSSRGGAIKPYVFDTTGGYAPEEQANFLEAIFQTFGNEPWWRGLYWWKWDEQNSRPNFKRDPKGDTGFTLHGKPAAEVMRKWYSRRA